VNNITFVILFYIVPEGHQHKSTHTDWMFKLSKIRAGKLYFNKLNV